jgi:predicted DNA-binding mobile mystery protein A
MTNQQRKLLLSQLEKKVAVFSATKQILSPGSGWVNAIRTAIGISLKQLGQRLNITAQGAKKIEERESDGSITISSLREAATALNMQLVYGFVPKEETLEKMIENRVRQVAARIVMRTSHTMHLENQALPQEELQRAIEEKTKELMTEMPRYIWD